MAAITTRVARTTKEAVVQFRCGTILAAARAVFARKGFEAALVDDIADEAGIAKGTVYLYFPSKKDIYLAALVEEFQRFHDQTVEAVDAAVGAREKIRAFAQVGLTNCRSHGDFLRIYVSEFSNQIQDPSRKPKALANIHQKRVNHLTAIIEEGIRLNAGMSSGDQLNSGATLPNERLPFCLQKVVPATSEVSATTLKPLL